MPYELAKELRDAGFPQRTDQQVNMFLGDKYYVDFDGDIETMSGYNLNTSKSIGVEQAYYKPLLSELIEECSDGFKGLHRLRIVGLDGAIRFYTTGSIDLFATPEEAIAKLWLKLKTITPL